jgi:hypothetical protein
MGAQSMSKTKRVFGSWRGFLMAVGLVALVAACGQQVQPAAPEVASFTATPDDDHGGRDEPAGMGGHRQRHHRDQHRR